MAESTATETIISEAGKMNENGLKTGFRAIVIGGTGVTGRCLVRELLQSKEFNEIVLLGRRKLELPSEDGLDLTKEEDNGRLKQVVVDMEQLNEENSLSHFEGKDVFFTCFGTTRKVAGSAQNFRHIDKGYNIKCAELARKANIPMYSLLSSKGANLRSWFLYLQVKGEIEDEASKLGFPNLSIFRPGILKRGADARFLEKATGWFMSSISVQPVAKAMCIDAINQLGQGISEEAKSSLHHNEQIHKIISAHSKISTEENKEDQESKKEETTEQEKKETTEEVKKETTEEVKKETTEEVKKETTEEVKKETTEEVKKETTEEVKKETTEPEKKETTEPEKKETTEPETKETTEPETKETTEPEKKETTEPETKETTEPKKKETTEPEKKETKEQEKAETQEQNKAAEEESIQATKKVNEETASTEAVAAVEEKK